MANLFLASHTAVNPGDLLPSVTAIESIHVFKCPEHTESSVHTATLRSLISATGNFRGVKISFASLRSLYWVRYGRFSCVG